MLNNTHNFYIFEPKYPWWVDFDFDWLLTLTLTFNKFFTFFFLKFLLRFLFSFFLTFIFFDFMIIIFVNLWCFLHFFFEFLLKFHFTLFFFPLILVLLGLLMSKLVHICPTTMPNSIHIIMKKCMISIPKNAWSQTTKKTINELDLLRLFAASSPNSLNCNSLI